ncbi:MAG: autotransporter-associated beta strand repeat-containing protein, partial [Planctomycetia bacterium]
MKRRTLCPISLSLMLSLVGVLLLTSLTQAADLQYQVTNQSQLSSAIVAANNVGAGDTVTITIRNNITLSSDLPALQKQGVTIVGQSNTGLPVTISGSSSCRGLLIDVTTPAVGSADVTLQNLNFRNCTAQGGDGGNGLVGGGAGAGLGGALMIKSGDVVAEDVYFLDNDAVGGNGGTVVNGLGAGGGGGLGGDGGNGGTNNGGPKAWTGGGGGGVGVGADGGDVVTTGTYNADNSVIDGSNGVYKNIDPTLLGGKAYAGENSPAGPVGKGGQYAGGGSASFGSNSSDSYGSGGGGGLGAAGTMDATRTNGGDGGWGGGGGGSMASGGGGDGGFGGGGGAAVLFGATGGNGGFGGGGGGAILTQDSGQGGFGAGDGAATGENEELGGYGGGGLGAGGAVFVENAANTSLTVQYSSAPLINPTSGSTATGTTATPFSGNGVTGGTSGGGAAGDGQGIGSAAFLGNDLTLKIDDWSGNSAVDMTIKQSFGGEAAEDRFDPTQAANAEADGGLIKTGLGTLVLSGNNSYTGDTQIQEGAIHASGGSAIGDYSNVVLSAGTEMKLLNSESIGWLTGAGGNINLNSKTLTLMGTAERDPAAIDYAGTFTSSGTGNGRINKEGTGTFQVSGNNAAANFKTYLYDGTTVFGSRNGLGLGTVYVRTKDTQYNTIEASATLGAETIVNDFSIGNTSVLKIGGDFNVNIAGSIRGPEVILDMNADATELRLSNIDLYDAADLAAAAAAEAAYQTALANAATANANLAAAIAAAAADPTDPALAAAVVAAQAAADAANAAAATAAETSKLAAVNPSSIERLTLRKGTLMLTQKSTLGGAVVNVEKSSTIGSDAGYAGTFANNIQLNDYSVLTVDTTTNDLTFSGGISGNGALRHDGPGTFTLANDNSYSGGTILGGGTLHLGTAAAAGTGLIQVVDDSTLTTAGDFTGTNNSIMNNFSLAGTKVLTIGGTQSMRLAGNISGAGGITLDSGQTLILAGTNTYTGPTTVLDGTLITETSSTTAGLINLTPGGGDTALFQLGANTTIGGLASSGAGTSTVDLGTYNLTVSGTTDANFTGSITGTGGLIKSGTNTQALSGTNTFTGDVTITEGTLALGGGSALD